MSASERDSRILDNERLKNDNLRAENQCLRAEIVKLARNRERAYRRIRDIMEETG